MSRPDPFAPIGGGVPAAATNRKAWEIVLPVPANAPAPLAEHFRLGKPSAWWTYLDAAGAVLGYVLRFDIGGGEKEFWPLTLWRCVNDGKLEWRWKSWPLKRPLYGLRRLAERPSAPVVVCEGEKAADAAGELLAAYVAVTSPNGSQSAHKADWKSLHGRRIVIWPDADLGGAQYANETAKQLAAVGAESVAIVSPPGGFVVVAKPLSTDDKRNTDWTAFSGRHVIVWSAGDAARADKIASEIRAVGAAWVTVKPQPRDGIEGWDAADAVAAGWDGDRAAALVAAALGAPIGASSAADEPNNHGGSGVGRRRPRQRDKLIGLTDLCEFWHDANRTAYVSFPIKEHREHWPIRSRDFRMWLSCRYYEDNDSAIGAQTLEDGIRILEARAVNDGPQHEPFIRVGRGGGKLYLDLCNAHWGAVEIDADGWRLIEAAPVKFLRSSSSRRLPEPEAGGLIEELRRFINVSDDDFMLVVAWLVATLRDRGPYPILVANGQHGAGKSIFSRLVRSLVDPSAAPIRTAPKDDRDLVVSAGNSWILAYDNLSKVAGWLSDAFCRLSTGGGFATRMLHTDREESIFEATRPVMINGITLLTERADLADRALTIHLQAPENSRRTEDEFWADFEAVRPMILGALLDAVSAALRNVSDVKLEWVPRMADFTKWCTAAESGLGWTKGSLATAYQRNRRDVSEAAFEADTVAVAIRDFVITNYPEGREVSPTLWWGDISAQVSEGIKKERSWPTSAQAFSNRVMRAKPLLEGKGFVIQFKHSTSRTIVIIPPRPARATA